MGHPEEPPLHELRQDVAGPQILLSGQYTEEGARREALLPVPAQPVRVEVHQEYLPPSAADGGPSCAAAATAAAGCSCAPQPDSSCAPEPGAGGGIRVAASRRTHRPHHHQRQGEGGEGKGARGEGEILLTAHGEIQH